MLVFCPYILNYQCQISFSFQYGRTLLNRCCIAFHQVLIDPGIEIVVESKYPSWFRDSGIIVSDM